MVFAPRNAGFTLPEMAVVLLIAGIMLTGALAMSGIFRSFGSAETEGRMKKISHAIDFYAIRNHRVPCPSSPQGDNVEAMEPYGYERGSGKRGDVVPPDCGADPKGWAGALPFRTLGLEARDAVDGHGRPFLYAISPAFAQNPYDKSLDVNASCRTKVWFYRSGPDSSEYLNTAPRKARFCCPGMKYGPETDITLLDSYGNNVLAQWRGAPEVQSMPEECAAIKDCSGFFCCSGLYASADTPFTLSPSVPAPPNHGQAVVYLLLSYGANGGDAASAPFEIENANGDRVFRYPASDDPFEITGAFDDMALWRTQDSIYALTGGSCVTP